MKVILSCSLYLGLSVMAMAASDPTKPDLQIAVPLSVEASKAEVLEVSAKFKLGLIKNVQGHYMALINGKSVKQGDDIEGYKVMNINRKQVVLQQADETLTLSLFKAMKTQ